MKRRLFCSAVGASVFSLSACTSPAYTRAQPWRWTEQPLTQDGLHGTLTLPEGGAPVTAVLLLAGSGPVDRDGNLPGMRSNHLKQLAEALAGQGFATLRVDKRGIGASAAAGMAEDELRFQTYVDDATRWLLALRTQPRVGRVVLMGHSEGALVATLVAQKVSVAALVTLAGAGRPAAELIAQQLADANTPQPLRAQAEAILARLLQGQPVDEVPPSLMALFRPSVQPYLMSWLPLDPAAELAKLKLPTLIVQGTHDMQVGLADAERLHAARPDARLARIEGMNHVLKLAPADRAENLRSYAEPERPLAPTLVPLLVDFLQRLPAA